MAKAGALASTVPFYRMKEKWVAPTTKRRKCGCSSVVERHVANVNVVGSTPITRSWRNIMEIQGYGCEWDAELFGGPADGCVDRVIQENGEHPPVYFKKLLNEEPQRKSLGEKILESWGTRHIDAKAKVAIYKLRGNPEEIDDDADSCLYDYLETTDMRNARKKYGFQ